MKIKHTIMMFRVLVTLALDPTAGRGDVRNASLSVVGTLVHYNC